MNTRFLGTQIPYAEGMRLMREAIDHIDTFGNQILFLEHADTITITRQHGTKSLLLPADEIQKRGIALVETDRGGDATFHGTGQLVGYPILKLPVSMGVCDYVRRLEVALIEACKEMGVKNAHRICDKTGVWVGDKKLIAIGVGVSRQVTRHGFALNLTTHLERFTECLTPCGLTGFGVTSLERELGHAPGLEEAMNVLSWHLQEIC
jgi:lipoyl(octanoyl) transferase